MKHIRKLSIMAFLSIFLCVSFVNFQNVSTLQTNGVLEKTIHSSSSTFGVNVGDNITYNFTFAPTPKIVGPITYGKADMLRFRVTTICSNAPINGYFADYVMGFLDFYNATTHAWTLDWLGIGGEFLISAYNGTSPLHFAPFGNLTWVSPFFMAVMLPTLMTPILSIAPNNQSSVNESMVLFYETWFTSTFPSLNYSWDFLVLCYHMGATYYSWNFWAGSPENQTTRFEYIFNTDLLCTSTRWYSNNSDNTDWELIYRLDFVPEEPLTSPTMDYSILVLYNNFLVGVQRFNEMLSWMGVMAGPVVVVTILIAWKIMSRNGVKRVKVKLKLPRHQR